MGRMSAKNRKDFERIKARTAEIVVGKIYFLSQFYAKQGQMVEVLETTTEINSAGWPSRVTVVVVENILGDFYTTHDEEYYAVGTLHTCNATNLYEEREHASHVNKSFLRHVV